MRRLALFGGVLAVIASALALYFAFGNSDAAVPDDAKAAGKTVADFPQTASHAFDAMDGAITLTDDERKGRNTWLLWTAGDQILWDTMAQHGFGTADLLKTIDSRTARLALS